MPRKRTHEEFINLSKEIHKDRFGYDKTVYIDSTKKVTLFCNEHKEYFNISPYDHLNTAVGCEKCKSLNRSRSKSINTEEFKKKYYNKFGDELYDLSLVDYKPKNAKIEVICKRCNNCFFVTPNSFLCGVGCSSCNLKEAVRNKTDTLEEFVEKAKKVHGSKYDYSKTVYTKSAEKVCVVCPEHGEFFTIAGSHISLGVGCPKCAQISRDKKQTFTLQEVIKKAKDVHGDLYKYEEGQIDYKNTRSKLNIHCNSCGNDFRQVANYHLSGIGCPKCARERIRLGSLKTTDDFIKDAISIHGNKYSYDKVDYKGHRKRVIITCPIHGDFYKTPAQHLKNIGCYDCSMENRIESGWTYTNWQLRAEHSKVFDSYKVYVLHCWNDKEDFLKVGRTYRKVKDRFCNNRDMPYNYEVLEEILFDSARECCEYEQELKDKNINKKYLPSIEFGGMFECFKI